MDKIAYEMHKHARKNFPRRQVELRGIGDLLQADLVEMIPYSKENKGYKYLLTMIDCFSEKAWAVPVKHKSTVNVTKSVESVLPNKVKNLQTDQGKEFFNSKFQALIKAHNINHYHTFTHLKASIIERFNKTLKQWMWKEFSSQGSYKWLDLLPKSLNRYNNKIHSSTGLKPNEVNKNNLTVNYKPEIKLKSKFKVGGTVRISKYKHIFAKGYQPSWTGELFTIYKIQHTNPVTYILKCEDGEIIKGEFYEQELLKTKFKDIFLIEKVLKRKGNQLYVKWLGFPPSKNSWVDSKDIFS